MIHLTLFRRTAIIFMAIFFLWICLIACNESDKSEKSVNPDQPSEPTARGLDKLNYMRLNNGRFRTDEDGKVPITNRQDFARTFDSLKKAESSIVIYFHGGLIPIKKTYTQPLTEGFDLAFRNGEHFPFYVLYGGGPGNVAWIFLESQFFNSEEADGDFAMEEASPLDEKLEKLKKKKSFLYLFGQMNKKFKGADGFKGTAYQPYKDTVNLERIVQTEIEQEADFAESVNEDFLDHKSLQKDFEKDLYADSTLQDLARKDMEDMPEFAGSKDAFANPIKFLYNVGLVIGGTVKRYATHRNHKIPMTLLEEIMHNATYLVVRTVTGIAQVGWDTSKRIVANAFLKNEQCGGTALLEELSKINEQAKQDGKPKHIWLVGSSTGTIMICELLKASRTPAFSHIRFNIIFSVASCTFDQFGQALDAAQDKISSFYMFGLSDKYERRGRFPFLGSILYFVSGVCESSDHPYHDKPIVGMQRFYRKDFLENAKFDLVPREKAKIERVINYLHMTDSYSTNVSWSHDSGTVAHPDLHNEATFHGGVIRNEKVQTSITTLLKKSNQKPGE